MVYRFTIEVGENNNGKFERTSYIEHHIFRYNIGRSLEHIIRFMSKDVEIYENVKNYEDARKRIK